MTEKQRYDYRKQNGLCVKCGKPNDTNRVHCSKCKNILSVYNKQTRELYQRYNTCPICRKYPIMGNEKICPECRARQANYNEKFKKKHEEEYKLYMYNYNKERTERFKKAGVCVRCGKPTNNNLKKCDRCRVNSSIYQKERRNLKKCMGSIII